MKIKKILIALVAALLVISSFSACAGESTEITVTLQLIAYNDEGEEDVIYDGPVTLNDPAPTVLMAVLEVNATYGLDVTLKSNDKSVASIKTYGDKTEESISYFWDYTKNGVAPNAESGGKAGDDVIANGDIIRYEYLTYDMNAETNA